MIIHLSIGQPVGYVLLSEKLFTKTATKIVIEISTRKIELYRRLRCSLAANATAAAPAGGCMIPSHAVVDITMTGANVVLTYTLKSGEVGCWLSDGKHQ